MHDETPTGKERATMTQRHANAPDYVMREGKRRFPLDLDGRVAWLREQADACVSEPDRHELERRIYRLRNGKEPR